MSFRDDGREALDWLASYLERVRELPVLARVSPGEVRARSTRLRPSRARRSPTSCASWTSGSFPG